MPRKALRILREGSFWALLGLSVAGSLITMEVARDPRAQLLLSVHGFEERFRAEGYVVLVRESPPGSD